MKEALKYWWMVLLKGIILIALSFFVFRHPAGALVGLALYLGIGLLIVGFLLIVFALSVRKEDDDWGWRLTEGILDVIFAVVLLSNPGVTAAVFPFVVGFWMMIYGVMLFSGSFTLKKSGDSNWWMSLLIGILTVLFGYFISANLMAGAIAITTWMGLGFLLVGILNVSASLKMRKLNAAVN